MLKNKSIYYNSEIKLSIVIPLYNAERYIEDTINTIYEANSIEDVCFELLLVNDGSNDKTNEICRELQKAHDNICYLEKKNEGIASARNEGLKAAQGKYVTFVDQDDMLIDGYKRYLDSLEHSNADFLMSNVTVLKDGILTKREAIDREGIISEETLTDMTKNIIGGAGMFSMADANNRNTVLPNSVWNCIFSMDFLTRNELLFHKYLDYEDDWIFIINALTRAEEVLLIPESYYCWKIIEGSASHSEKYIDNYYDKRKALVRWIIKTCKEHNCNDQELSRFESLMKYRTVLWALYNEYSRKPIDIHLTEREVQSVVVSEHPQYKEDYCIGFDRVDRFLIKMLCKGSVNMAVWLNMHFFKRHFH